MTTHTGRPSGVSPASSHKPGSQSALRDQNVQRVVESLSAAPCTQAALARQTGLSTATISNIVRAMVARGIATTSPTTSSGRRALLVRLEARGAVVVGLDLGRRHARVLLADLGREVIGERYGPLAPGHRAHEAIAAGELLLEEVLEEHNVARSAVVGVGVGIPGPLDRRTGAVLTGTMWPEWSGVAAPQALHDALGLPVVVDNDANLGALAEVTWGAHSSVENLVFLKLGSGIGCGLIVDGRPFHGQLGIAGELGHSPVSDGGARCRCGNVGCLEMAASTSAMIQALDPTGQRGLTTADIVLDAIAGDTATLRVLDDAGTAVGRALASVVNLINPQVVVVGGPLADLGEVLLAPIRRGMLRFALPIAGAATTLAVSSLGDRAEALGAASLVSRQIGLRLS